jgi:ATP-dependent Clp protease ATP-binding subunit ClpC
MRGLLPYLRDMAKELRQSSTCRALAQSEFTHAAINELFRDKPELVGEFFVDQPKVLESSPATANFTPRAQQVLALARREADRRHDNFVGTEHLLLGIIALGQGVATNVLLKEGLDLEKVREAVEKSVGPAKNQAVIGNIPYTPRTKRVLALAAKEAKALNHTYVGTEHLLLGLLHDDEGAAGKILRDLGVHIEETRNDILKELDPNA